MSLKDILNKHNVSTTALLAIYWKNAAKSRENWDALCVQRGSRQKDLFQDNLMEWFIDADVKHEAEARLDKKMWLPLATRTRFFRRTVAQQVKSGNAEQVILLGAGFDTLAMRKQKYTALYGAKFFEIDMPEIIAAKQEILENHDRLSNATPIPLDYVRGDLLYALQTNGVDFTRPTMILWEGNTFYLEKQDVIRILSSLAQAFDKLTISFDFMHTAMQRNTDQLDDAANSQSLKQTLDAFDKRKVPFRSFFDPEEMTEICNNLGLVCEASKTAAELAVEYEVDSDPWYTAKPYSVATYRRPSR